MNRDEFGAPLVLLPTTTTQVESSTSVSLSRAAPMLSKTCSLMASLPCSSPRVCALALSLSRSSIWCRFCVICGCSPCELVLGKGICLDRTVGGMLGIWEFWLGFWWPWEGVLDLVRRYGVSFNLMNWLDLGSVIGWLWWIWFDFSIGWLGVFF